MFVHRSIELTENISDFDYKIRGISEGLRRIFDQPFAKNNYNYIIKVEEI